MSERQVKPTNLGAANYTALSSLLMLMIGLVVGLSSSTAAAQPGPISLTPQNTTQTTPVCSYTIVNTYPHDPGAFTQGLVFDKGELFEGTGRWGESTLRRVDLETGVVLQNLDLSATYFGEGVTAHKDRLIQLTYTSGIGFVYDRETFALMDDFVFTGEGWGLTHDHKQLIMSDGTSYLRFLNLYTFAETGQIQVSDDKGPVIRLNELEYINGEVLANIWQTNLIARINPTTGQVIAYIDLTGLLGPGPWTPPPDVLNGIAFDSENNHLFVTGKRWPHLFEIELSGCPPLPVFVDTFESGDTSAWSTALRSVWQPSPGTSWQWQLTGTIDTSVDVQMYDIDLFDTPQSVIDQLHADGRTVICYFSAGSWENWRPDQADFPLAVLGNDLDGWPGEKWLDIRDLGTLGPIMEARLDLAVEKSCDGVEPDNIDGYTNTTGFPLSSADQITYNTFLADEAHLRGLSIGLKNDLDQVTELLPYFNWALNEQCHEYDECDLLDPFVAAGKAVFGVEYIGNPAVFCPLFNNRWFSWLQKNLNLDAWRIDCGAY